ncbi:MAG: lysophospholipid acyltransferase family protein [Myxococcales bacterium]|nr:lysophospholipid acyltransferase family protein [Myxococcales bacterium]
MNRPSDPGPLALEGSFWRRLARWGAQGPEWFVRASPAVVGVVAGAVAGDARRHVRRNLRRVRGERGPVQDAVDVARTFASYASCLAEILGAGSARGRLPHAVIWGEPHLQDAQDEGRGVILATAHTAGWETVGPLLSRDHALPVMIAEGAERDQRARALQDDARKAHGLLVAHVGDDPLSALVLSRHLRAGGAVAIQIDRAPSQLRARAVRLFGEPARMPEGPLRLSMWTRAPVVPVFVARTGYRRYEVFVEAPIRLARAATDADLDAAAQSLADAMQHFVRAHPTQWFHFKGD